MSQDKWGATPALLGAEWRDFLHWPLYCALAFFFVTAVVAYQWPGGASVQVDVGSQADSPYLSGFFEPESNPDINYRWSGGVSTFTLPGVGRRVSLEITLCLAGRPPGSPASRSGIIIDSVSVTTLEPTGYPCNPYAVSIPASVNRDDNLVITLTSTTFSPAEDARKLGVVVDRIGVKQTSAGFVLPPVYPLAWLLLCLLLGYMTLRHVGVGRRVTTLATMASGALIAFMLATARYDLTLIVAELGTVMICVYVLALLIPLMAVWSMRRLRVGITEGELRWLMLIYLLAFTVKAGGMMHPQFVDLDQGFRVHQVQELVNDPTLFWGKYQHVTTADEETGTIHSAQKHSMLGQWDLVVPFPYSPVGYFVLAPLGWIWPNGNEAKLITASDTMLAALSGTIVFALFAIARKGLGIGLAGIFAGAIVSFAPITYLHFSDGAYPYIWAGWISVVYLMAAICLADRASKPWPFVLLSVLSALTILSHTALAFFALAFIAAVMLVQWVIRWRCWGLQIGDLSLRPMLLSFLAGGALSLVYYGGYIMPILTVSLPALMNRGLNNGVGLDRRYLGATLLNGFWSQLGAHFALWPALLAAIGLALIGVDLAKRVTEPTRPGMNEHITGVINHAPTDVFRLVAFVFIVAWAITFLIFSAIDSRVNLLQRHMLFGLPLVALLAGYTLAKINSNAGKTTRFLHAPLLAGLLVAYLFLVGWDLWTGRVLYYVLPPGSG